MGGLGVGPVERGITTTVRLARFRASAVRTTAGRVFRISLPRAGSRLTHHMSPRRIADGALAGEPLIGLALQGHPAPLRPRR